MGLPAARRTAFGVLLAVSLLASAWAPAGHAAPAKPPTEEQIGTLPIKVRGPQKQKNGATLGTIPIGYIGTNTNRNGAYYLPKGYQQRRLPVLIMLHGSGIDGFYIVSKYRALADKYKFIIIAPSSHRQLYWFSPATTAKPFTEDFYHVIACYRYVRRIRNVLFDYNRIAMGGNSRGGYSAVSLATRTPLASHALCTHSRFLAEQTGSYVRPIWVSTGDKDSLFSPSSMKKYLAAFQKVKKKFKITFRVFKGGHSVGHADELEATIKWWYSTKGARAVKY